MIRLYHMGESTCSQRVRLTLAEKRLEWESDLVAGPRLRAPDYIALNPAGVVPTLQHDGDVIVESRLICEYLEDAFPEVPMMPASPIARFRMRRWTKSYDDTLHLGIFVLSFNSWMRQSFEGLPDEVLDVVLPGFQDPVKRYVSRDLLESEWASGTVAIALERMTVLLADLEATLSGHAWLAGDAFSFADIDMFVIVQRLDDLGLSRLRASHGAVSDWLERIRDRSSFDAAFTHFRSKETIARSAEIAERAAPHFERILASI